MKSNDETLGGPLGRPFASSSGGPLVSSSVVPRWTLVGPTASLSVSPEEAPLKRSLHPLVSRNSNYLIPIGKYILTVGPSGGLLEGPLVDSQ